MTDDIEPSQDEIDRWTRNLLKPSKPTPASAEEQKIIAKVFGTKTQAEQFLRHERKPGRVDIRSPRTFKDRKPVIRFEYWEREGDEYSHSGWTIERYENGKLMVEHRGQDWQKRDALLIKLQAAGFTCKPVTVAGVEPQPIQGRMRDKRRPPSGRFDIMSQIAKLTTDDLVNDD